MIRGNNAKDLLGAVLWRSMTIRLLTVAAFLAILVRLVLVASTTHRVPNAAGPVEIEMSVWGMPWENDLYTGVYIPEFERQNPGIKVRFHHFEDYGNRILLSHAGEIPPDVIRENLSFSMGWIRRGVNLPLNKYINGSDGIDRRDFIPFLWNDLTYQGETYGVPQDINIVGLFYNKDLFDKAGLSYPNENWTWDDLKTAGQKLTVDRDGDGHPEIVGIDMAWGAAGFQPFLYQAGEKFWNAERNRSAFDTPEAAKALAFYKSLMGSYSISQSSSVRGGLGPDKFFETGKVGIFFDGSWRTPSLKKNAPNLRFGVAPLPGGRKKMSVSGSCFWAVSSLSKHPNEAWKLVKFLSSKEALIKYWQFLWVAPPARWSALRSPEFMKITGANGKIPGVDSKREFDEKCGWITKVLEHGWTTTEVCSPYTDRLMLHLGEGVDKVLLQNADPAKALHESAIKTDEQIKDAEIAEQLLKGGQR